jgi:cyanophycin synthetase
MKAAKIIVREMRVIETKVLRGPNQWSVQEKQLIVLKAEVGEQDPAAEDLLHRRMSEMFPEIAHLHSGTPTGTPATLALLALGLQNSAGMPVAFFQTEKAPEQGTYYIAYSYQVEQAGLYAGDAAAELAQELLNGGKPDLAFHLEELELLKRRYSIGPTSTYLLDEVKRRNIPYKQFDNGSLITLGHGNRQKKIRTAVTDATSALGLEMAGDKEETKKILAEANLPVPRGILVRSERELVERIGEVRYPIVLKPLDGNHGRGVTTDISSFEKALFGFNIASRISTPVIVEEFVKGDDYRFLVINFQLVAAALRMPAYVTGNGTSTIEELIEEENRNPQRGDTSEHVLAKIKVDDVTKKILTEKKLTLASVLPKGERLILKDTANISAGGTATDVTDQVHPENKFMVERVARLFNLDICGIDIMATAIDVPITREVGAIIEVNAGPGLRMHSNPQAGPKRDVARPILEMLFRTTAAAEIPVIAVTGTNGKTTTTRLIAYMAAKAGHHPGFCTSDGIYIDGHLTYEGDCTGYVSAQQVLFDPSIDFAVLECARGGIIRSGLGFDRCDISVVTNISEDHLGMKGVNTLQDMARVKAVVPKSTRTTGYAILNADDTNVYSLHKEVTCNVALFSLDPENERVKSHLRNNGMAAVLENGNITVFHGHKTVIATVDEIPLTFGGKAEFMVKNVLAATLAGIISGFDTAIIREALTTFVPSAELTPGRMNAFSFDGFRVIVDYVHNLDGFREIKKFLARTEGHKIGVIAAPGDRRDSDISGIGMLAATSFDEIVVRSDKDLRGRTGEEISNLLCSGIQQVNSEVPVNVIADEKEAIDYALSRARPGCTIFICADKVKDTLDYVQALATQAPDLKSR